VLRWGAETGFRMPRRNRSTTELQWSVLGGSRLHDMLHNPTYAGVYSYGRRPKKQELVDGEVRTIRRALERSEWPVCIDNAHPAYISWETYMDNQDKLRRNRSNPASAGAPRQGCALLVGILLCGRCGRRMSPHYDKATVASRGSRWLYTCYAQSSSGNNVCWSVAGGRIDEAIEGLFLDTMVPSEIELSLAVEHEAGQQAESLARAWRTRLEQVRYEARLAERRYKAVDPEHRVVARTLENEWEQRLHDVADVERQYDETRNRQKVELTVEDRKCIRELARDLPAVWKSPSTSIADRKAMLQLAIEAIALHPVEVPERGTRVHVQWHGAATSELLIPRPRAREAHATPSQSLDELRRLAAKGLHDEEIAVELNRLGLRTGFGNPWNLDGVRQARSRLRIPRVAPDRPRRPSLPARDAEGRYSVPAAAAKFDVSHAVVYRWVKRGHVPAIRADHGLHRNAYWLEIDARTEAELKVRAQLGRSMRRHQ